MSDPSIIELKDAPMAVATRLSVAEYLQRNDSPACELVAGELIAKPMPTRSHVRMQARLEELLKRFEAQALGETYRELTIRHEDDFRIPDLVFIAQGSRFEDDILTDPPILCIEVVSPSQRQSELFAKCEIYHDWGVPYCWVIDPVAKSVWEYHRHSQVTSMTDDQSLTAGEIKLLVSNLFE